MKRFIQKRLPMRFSPAVNAFNKKVCPMKADFSKSILIDNRYECEFNV
jgi:hypothetical protein